MPEVRRRILKDQSLVISYQCPSPACKISFSTHIRTRFKAQTHLQPTRCPLCGSNASKPTQVPNPFADRALQVKFVGSSPRD